MNLSLHLTNTLSVKELLFIGFDGDFDANICNFPYESQTYRHTIINQRDAALAWLSAQVDQVAVPPYAVLCELEWLEKDHFQLVDAMRKHPKLQNVPVVALTKGNRMDSAGLARKGVDDCYTIPIEWLLLEERLIFLQEYKSEIVEKANSLQVEKIAIKIHPMKRAFDIAAALAGLIVLSPVMLLTALAIRLESKGPVLYRSRRVGAGYHTFDFFKFRSMYEDADQRLAELKHLNQYEDTNAVFMKFVNDPRITKVGRFIRKYSIDELPQLINILKGDMSIVGNRPLPTYEAAVLTNDEWSARFLAPAGLTGLWQVTKRGNNNAMSTEERIALDIQYSKEYDFWTDMSIIFRTFTSFVQKENV